MTPPRMDHPVYVAHLSHANDHTLTFCGSAWQGWQATPEVREAATLRGHILLRPMDPPEPHVDLVASCGACMQALHHYHAPEES